MCKLQKWMTGISIALVVYLICAGFVDYFNSTSMWMRGLIVGVTAGLIIGVLVTAVTMAIFYMSCSGEEFYEENN